MPRVKKRIRIIDWLNMGIFPPTICFVCGFTKAELCDHLKRMKANDWLTAIKDATIDPRYWYGKKIDVEHVRSGEIKSYLFIIIPRFDFLDDDFVKLAHEITHVCQFYLPDANVNRDREIECEAYLHTHIMRQCIKKLRG